jgi:hypothetical protein
VLEVDGKQLPQSHAIERFLARRFNLLGILILLEVVDFILFSLLFSVSMLVGSSDFEAAQIDGNTLKHCCTMKITCHLCSLAFTAVCEQFVDIKDSYQKAKKENETKKFFTTDLPQQFAMVL